MSWCLVCCDIVHPQAPGIVSAYECVVLPGIYDTVFEYVHALYC